MRKYLTVMMGGAVCGFLIAGCHDDSGNAPTPPAPSATMFESYAQELIQGSTCEKANPVQTNNIAFSFAADQDTADPRDISAIAPACAAS
jgi:hypothetical protein